ncbi:sensor protein ZraS [bacterium BMS3Abin10]|nr:sensor protein ZraS [bacterium BMS3Abin10]GBE39973.1 sensor protein ZraS [bacterium BMS3Bbin08]HDH50433.1 PAS domain-containing protein [Nitrospirota bacterium]HDK16323.1 PAS domain-containing protein [Nitrospirota bacterium]
MEFSGHIAAKGMFEDALKRLKVLIFARAVVVSFFLGSYYIFRIGDVMFLSPAVFSSFIVSLYALTIIYAVLLRRVKTQARLTVFAYIQIVIDIFTETVLVSLTGGIASWFSFTYLLSIIAASIVLSRRASYYTASLSSVLYGLIIEFQFYYRPASVAEGGFSETAYIYNVFAHMVAFFLVAFLSGHLSERLHIVTEALQRKEMFIDDLRALSKDIVESMPSGVFTTNLDWGIVTFNTAAQKITGLGLADAIGKKPHDIFPFLKNIEEPFHRVEGEITGRGQTLYIGIRFSNLRDSEGKRIGMLGIFQDLTQLKAMETEMRKKEKWAFIGELSALIAHELRNPLASLKASVEMLLEKKVSNQHADQLMKIALSEMDRLNGIVTDFLLYAKPQQMRKDFFDLNRSLKDLAMLLCGSESVNKNIKISEDLQGELFMTGDSKQLQQVFWNLGTNAIDAVSEGGELIISTEKKDGSIEVVFADTGKGISKDDMDNIFYPFFTTKEGGTGLGLAIAQRITEAHGGKIKVEPNGAGAGTTFRVVLPVLDA